jgi:hypothetical protein
MEANYEQVTKYLTSYRFPELRESEKTLLIYINNLKIMRVSQFNSQQSSLPSSSELVLQEIDLMDSSVNTLTLPWDT